MTDPPSSPNRRRSNVGLNMLPSNNSLVEASDGPTMVDWFSSAGALSGLSREEQEVLNSNVGGRRLSDISFDLGNLVARRLSGCDNGISNDFPSRKGEAVQNMMGMSAMERLIAERRMPSVPPSLTIQNDLGFKLGVIDNARRRRRSSMSQVSQGDFSQISQVSRRKSLELAALENAARRRRSSMSQKSDFSQTTQQFQRECLELAALEKVTRNNSLDLLGDVAALASSNSSTSTGAANNVDGVGDILKNLTASKSPNRTSLDILSEATIALSAKNDRDNKILSQSIRELNNKREMFPFEKDEPNQLFDKNSSSATFSELGGDRSSSFGIRQTALVNDSEQQIQHHMKQTAQNPLERAQQQQREISERIQQQMQQQAEYEMSQEAHRKAQQQAQQDIEYQAQELKHQAQEELKRKAEEGMKQQARRNMEHQAQLEMQIQIEEHRKRQAQQMMEKQNQQQMERQVQNNELSGQSTRNTFDDLNNIELNGANYNRSMQSASYIYGSHESDIGNCKTTNTEPNFLPNQSLTGQRLANPQSPQVLNSNEPLLKDFSKSIQNSQKSQKNIQSWDKKMGLKRSHSATMTKTTQSRNRIKKFLESLTGFPDGGVTRKVGRGPSKKKRKAEIDEGSGGFY